MLAGTDLNSRADTERRREENSCPTAGDSLSEDALLVASRFSAFVERTARFGFGLYFTALSRLVSSFTAL
jgi:hypothetical protein